MFKITIREAILLTTIAALALMLWTEGRKNARNDTRLAAIEAFLRSIPVVDAGGRMPSQAVPPTAGGYVPIAPITPIGSGSPQAGTDAWRYAPVGPPITPQLSDNG